jgi:hypothetical protein
MTVKKELNAGKENVAEHKYTNVIQYDLFSVCHSFLAANGHFVNVTRFFNAPAIV